MKDDRRKTLHNYSYIWCKQAYDIELPHKYHFLQPTDTTTDLGPLLQPEDT